MDTKPDFINPNQNQTPPVYVIPPHKSVSHWLIVAMAIIAVIGYFMTSYYYALWPFGDLLAPIPTPVACTEEAKICPDGSAIGRTGPNCEFAPCPGEVDTSTWQTYRNEEYGFEFRYPEDGVLEQDDLSRRDRIQNYSSYDKVMGLKSGEYYIEIFLTNIYSCAALGIENPVTKMIDDIKVVVGSGPFGPYSGYIGGDVRIICVDNKMAIEISFESSSLSLASQIISTFRFIR